ncbi:MAG: NifB/NifX family molybdenum-iron cluster-binding protein [Rikenellaceae bacterium]
MKIAIPTRDNNVDNHFGHCAYYSIYEVEDGKVVSQERLEAPQGCGCKSNIASILKEMNVDLMLAGDMGMGAKNKLEQSGIDVIRGCSGMVGLVLAAYLAGRIQDSGVGCNHTHEDGHVCEGH